MLSNTVRAILPPSEFLLISPSTSAILRRIQESSSSYLFSYGSVPLPLEGLQIFLPFILLKGILYCYLYLVILGYISNPDYLSIQNLILFWYLEYCWVDFILSCKAYFIMLYIRVHGHPYHLSDLIMNWHVFLPTHWQMWFVFISHLSVPNFFPCGHPTFIILLRVHTCILVFYLSSSPHFSSSDLFISHHFCNMCNYFLFCWAFPPLPTVVQADW